MPKSRGMLQTRCSRSRDLIDIAVVFFSYSYADKGRHDRLEKSLTTLKGLGAIGAFHDKCIPLGNLLDDFKDVALEWADLILALVNPDPKRRSSFIDFETDV